MTDNEKLAKALGLVNEGDWWRIPATGGVVMCNKIGGYLTSPAGREAVRDRVRELWLINKDYHIELNYYNSYTVLNLRHLDIIKQALSGDCDESKIWPDALLWLDERGE